MNIAFLPDTVSSSTSLLNLHGIPWKIVIDDNIGKLQVQAFSTGISRDKYVSAISEILESKIPFVDCHTAIEGRYSVPVTCKDALKVLLSGNELSKDDYLLIAVLPDYFIYRIEQMFNFDIWVLKLSLLCNGNDVLKL